jgi:hypothetical protein
MKKDTQTTDIIFRKYPEGDIIAIFPHECNDRRGNVTSYMQTGQHSSADYKGVISSTKPATLAESNDLFHELKGLGYDIRIVARQNYAKYLDNFIKSVPV